MWWMEVILVPVLHCALPHSPGIFFSSHIHFLFYTNTWAYLCIVNHILFIWTVTQRSSSRFRLLITQKYQGGDSVCPVSTWAFTSSPPDFSILRSLEHTAAATFLPPHLHPVLTFLQKTPPLVSSSFCYQTLHELVEQSSVFRDGVITFLLYKHAGSLSQAVNSYSVMTHCLN